VLRSAYSSVFIYEVSVIYLLLMLCDVSTVTTLYTGRSKRKASHGECEWLLLCTLRMSGVPMGVWSIQTPPKFRSFDTVEPDCKLSGKCLVFVFQHPN
jgi:hypothetical protein